MWYDSPVELEYSEDFPETDDDIVAWILYRDVAIRAIVAPNPQAEGEVIPLDGDSILVVYSPEWMSDLTGKYFHWDDDYFDINGFGRELERELIRSVDLWARSYLGLSTLETKLL